MPSPAERLSESYPLIDKSSIRIKSPALAGIEKSLLQNIGSLESLLGMPRLLVCFLGVVRDMSFISFKHAVQASIAKDSVEGTAPSLFEQLDSYVDNHERFRQLWSGSGEELKKLCESETSYGLRLTAAMEVLKLAVVSGSWTALECAASDCWVAALNQSPTPLAHRAITSMPQENEITEISSRQIPVGLAAKYNFDLRNCLGTILKPKFDFTSIAGIKKAFTVAFKGSDQIAQLQRILSDPVLWELEVTRNLIVHRAGIVDEEYNKLLSADLPLGKSLELTDTSVRKFAEKSAIAAISVLIFVDDWLNTQT